MLIMWSRGFIYVFYFVKRRLASHGNLISDVSALTAGMLTYEVWFHYRKPRLRLSTAINLATRTVLTR